MERRRQVDRAVAVACGADELRAFSSGEEQLQPLCCERLVISDQNSQLFVSHSSPPAL
jgi:hypothetical protein